MIASPDIEKLMPILERVASQCEFVLELGPAQGNGSTRAFMAGLKKSERSKKLCISVDIRDYMEVKPTEKYWHLVLGDSRDAQTHLAVKWIAKRTADLIFIDTHHTYEQMKIELEIWHKIATDTTVWLFHDTNMMGEYNHMTDAIKEFATSHGWVYEEVTDDSHGLGMMYNKWRPTL